jgi:hypothetical protein
VKLSAHQLAQLYIEVAAAVHASLTNKGKSRPAFAAHMAKEHALAAVAAATERRRSQKGDRS